jgi:uncharacterized protein (TIGR02246 family)
MFGAHTLLTRLRSAPARRDLEGRVRLLEAERSARELVHAHAYAFDAKDVDLLLELYADDAVLVNSFGTWRGREAIRRSHEHDAAKTSYSFHNLTNVVVTVGESGDEAWVSAYLQNVQARAADVQGTIATGLFHVRESGGVWKIVECRTAPAGKHALQPAAGSAEPGRPEPSDPQTSADLTSSDLTR